MCLRSFYIRMFSSREKALVTRKNGGFSTSGCECEVPIEALSALEDHVSKDFF